MYDDHGEPLPDSELVCPGWLARQPEVMEGAHALSVRRDGALELYYPGLEHAVLQAADVIGGAIAEYEAEKMRRG